MLYGPEELVPHSQGLPNNPYLEPNQPNISYWYLFLRFFLILSSHLRLGLPKGLFLVGLSVKTLKVLLPSSILAIYPVHFNLLDYTT